MIHDLPKSTRTLVIFYLGVRRAIGAVGLLLPILLGPVGWLVFGIDIQDNMSSYYHTILRDVFVGALCTIGVFLFCYRGYDWIESWSANFETPRSTPPVYKPTEHEGLSRFPGDSDREAGMPGRSRRRRLANTENRHQRLVNKQVTANRRWC